MNEENIMTDIKNQKQAPAAFDFDKAKGSAAVEQSITRYPVVEWKELAGEKNDNKAIVVCGYVVASHRLNNPKGAERKTDFWLAAVVRLTHPCPAIITGEKGKERIMAQPGDEVYVPYGSDETDLAKHLQPLLGLEMMFWAAIRPDGVVKMDAGRNPMRKFEVLIGKEGEYAPIKRTGKYLLGMAKEPLQIEAPKDATPAQQNAARETVSSLQG